MKLNGFSDEEMADAIISCLNSVILRNSTKIKAGAIESDFKVSFCLQVDVDFTDPTKIDISAKGCVQPALFESVKIGKPWH